MSRNYSSISVERSLTANVSTDPLNVLYGKITVDSTDGFPSIPYVLVLDPDTSSEEAVLVTSSAGGTSLNVSRAIENGASAKSHSSGGKVRHMIVGSDLQLTNDHMDLTEDVHGISDSASLVYLNTSQTLTNKRLDAPKINENVSLTATSSELNILDGATLTTSELNILDGVTATAAEISTLHTSGVTTADLTKLHDVTSSAAELNILDGTTAVTSDLNKLHDVTSSAAELNVLDGVPSTVTATEIGYLDGVTSAIQSQINGRAFGLSTGVSALDSTDVTITSTSSASPTTIDSFTLNLTEQCSVLIISNVTMDVTATSGASCSIGIQVAGATTASYSIGAVFGDTDGYHNAVTMRLVTLNSGANTISVRGNKSGGTYVATLYNTVAVPVKALA